MARIESALESGAWRCGVMSVCSETASWLLLPGWWLLLLLWLTFSRCGIINRVASSWPWTPLRSCRERNLLHRWRSL